MNGKHARHLAILIIAGVALRIAIFRYVGIWGDMGFYTYDSRLILEGQTPFVDFVGRSPLFNYGFAYFRDAFRYPVIGLRAFISLWWVLCALPVYGIASRTHSHRAGLAGAAVLLLSPFGVVYGMWANTQSMMALCAITAAYVLVRFEKPRWYAVVGILLGLGFLSRRSIVTIAVGMALWVVYCAIKDRSLVQVPVRGASMAGGFFGILVAGYGLIALHEGNLNLLWPLWETHINGLISSSGRGGFPLVTKMEKPPVTNRIKHGRIPIFNDLCQMCGMWTARTFAKTLLVTVTLVGPLFFYFRDWTDRYFIQRDRQYLFGILVALALYATARAFLAGYYLRVGTVLSLGLFAFLAYRTAGIERRTLYSREMKLMLMCLGMLSAGYLYRNRVLHTYYFMDFLPLLSVVTGVLYAELLDRLPEPIWQSVSVKQVLAVALVLGVITSTAAAHPLVVVLAGNDAGWFTVENIQTYQDDLPKRAADKPVFTGHPSYVAGSEVRMLFDMPRIHYYANTFHGTPYGDRLYDRLTEALRTGQAHIVIGGSMTKQILVLNESAKKAFERNYCRVENENGQELYQRTGGTLFEYVGEGGCPPSREPDLESM